MIEPAVKKSPIPNPERVLFLANSLIYYSGGLQTHTHRLAAAGNPPLNVKDGFRSMHITGAGLELYPIEYAVTPGNLADEPYQLLVLAGSSQDGLSDKRRALYREKVKEADALIRKHGGRTALVWLPAAVKPHPLADTDMDEKTEELVLSVANEVGALVIPIGLAYREARRQRPDLDLMVYDGNHPSLAGQYLSACVLYATLYELSPVGNPYDYYGKLDADTKAFVQKVADDTVKKFFGR